MRALKIIVTAVLAILALTAGVFVAVAVAVVGLGAYLGTRLLGKPGANRAVPPVRRAATRESPRGAIDISATEVPVGSPPPQELNSGGDRVRD